jgi:hypothetical protein
MRVGLRFRGSVRKLQPSPGTLLSPAPTEEP